VCLEQGFEGIDVAVESRRVYGAVGAGVCLWVLDVGEEGGRERWREGRGVRGGRTGTALMPPDLCVGFASSGRTQGRTYYLGKCYDKLYRDRGIPCKRKHTLWPPPP